MTGSPGAGQPPAGKLLAGHVGEDAGKLGVGKSADFRAEEDFRRPHGRGQPLVAVDQPGQLGGQPPLGGPPARDRPDARPPTPSISSWPRSVKNRRHCPRRRRRG